MMSIGWSRIAVYAARSRPDMDDALDGAIFILRYLLPAQILPISIVILFISHSYAALPRLTHHLLHTRSKARIYDDLRFRFRKRFDLF